MSDEAMEELRCRVHAEVEMLLRRADHFTLTEIMAVLDAQSAVPVDKREVLSVIRRHAGLVAMCTITLDDGMWMRGVKRNVSTKRNFIGSGR